MALVVTVDRGLQLVQQESHLYKILKSIFTVAEWTELKELYCKKGKYEYHCSVDKKIMLEVCSMTESVRANDDRDLQRSCLD